MTDIARAAAKAIASIIDGEDLKIIGVGIIVILVVGLCLILLGLAAGVAVNVFDAMRF